MTALYIGGVAQGKRALVRRIYGENAPILENLHLLVQETMEQGNDPMTLLPLLRGQIVICDAVGCGIVPMDRLEREWREAVGRLCCALAAEADLVVRVTAGLPQVLMGELP